MGAALSKRVGSSPKGRASQHVVCIRYFVAFRGAFRLQRACFRRAVRKVSESLLSSKGKFVNRLSPKGLVVSVELSLTMLLGHKTGNLNYHCHHFHRCHHHLCHHHAAAYLTSIVSRQYPPISPICPSPSTSSSS